MDTFPGGDLSRAIRREIRRAVPPPVSTPTQQHPPDEPTTITRTGRVVTLYALRYYACSGDLPAEHDPAWTAHLTGEAAEAVASGALTVTIPAEE